MCQSSHEVIIGKFIFIKNQVTQEFKITKKPAKFCDIEIIQPFLMFVSRRHYYSFPKKGYKKWWTPQYGVIKRRNIMLLFTNTNQIFK